MDKINIYNYEAYFLDYSEGNLSVQEIAALKLFLMDHPELADELKDFEAAMQLKPQPISMNNPKMLKRDEISGLTEMEMLMIGAAEKELSEEELQELSKHMLDAKIEEEALIYQKIKLKANTKIAYFGKEQLKHKEKIYWKPYMNIAAGLVAAMVLWFSFPENEARYSIRTIDHNATENFNEKEEIHLLMQNEYLEKETEKKLGTTAEKIILKSIPKKEYIVFAEVSKPQLIENKNLKLNEYVAQQVDQVENEILPDFEVMDKEQKVTASNSTTSEEYQSVTSFLLNKFNSEVLKNKTFSEALVEEVSKATNEKVEFRRNSEVGKNEGFAFVLGKVSISHSKSR